MTEFTQLGNLRIPPRLLAERFPVQSQPIVLCSWPWDVVSDEVVGKSIVFECVPLKHTKLGVHGANQVCLDAVPAISEDIEGGHIDWDSGVGDGLSVDRLHIVGSGQRSPGGRCDSGCGIDYYPVNTWI